MTTPGPSTWVTRMVAFVDSLDGVGALTEQPAFAEADFPHGVNIEFVVRRGPDEVAMRVHERGWARPGPGHRCLRRRGGGRVAERQRCRSSSAATPDDVHRAGAGRDAHGDLGTDKHVHLKGPAVLVAEGTWRD